MPDFTAAKLKILAEAEILRHRAAPASRTAPFRLKAVLLVLAAHEGEYLSITGIAARTGMSTKNVASALADLVFMRLIGRGPEGTHHLRLRAVRWHALAALATREPLYRRGGTAPANWSRKAVLRRARDARYRERRRRGLAGRPRPGAEAAA